MLCGVAQAYTLGQGLYSTEAIDQLVALMTTPEHLNKTVVILAGYQVEMERMLGSNEGLRSRVTGRIEFPDWDADDCVEAVRQKCEREAIRLTDAAAKVLVDELAEIRQRPGWANARDSVITFRLLYKARAQRCALAAEDEPSYVEQDAVAAMKSLRETRPLGDPRGGAEDAIEAAAIAAIEAARRLPQIRAALPPQRQIEVVSELEVEDITDEVEEQQAAPQKSDTEDPVYVALLKACVAEGYDESHERRQELVTILEAVKARRSAHSHFCVPLRASSII